jgi:tetratricopeptide (TPR) repeat protein
MWERALGSIVMLRLITLCIAVILAIPAAWADDYKDCNQDDLDLKIRGCTAIITRGRETKPNLAIAYINRGVAYAAKGGYGQAIADFDQALTLGPNDAPAYNNRGVAYERKGDYSQAIADFDQAIKLDPKYRDAYVNRGVAYEEKGDKQRAIADYRQARTINPTDVDAKNALLRLGAVR